MQGARRRCALDSVTVDRLPPWILSLQIAFPPWILSLQIAYPLGKDQYKVNCSLFEAALVRYSGI
jgi:hypothetical protein